MAFGRGTAGKGRDEEGGACGGGRFEVGGEALGGWRFEV